MADQIDWIALAVFLFFFILVTLMNGINPDVSRLTLWIRFTALTNVYHGTLCFSKMTALSYITIAFTQII